MTDQQRARVDDIKNCARCGEDHPSMTFRPFTNPNETYAWWALCPTLGEPILMKVVEGTIQKAFDDLFGSQEKAKHPSDAELEASERAVFGQRNRDK
jgi:hypothetical protein